MIEPSNAERATWPDATCDYVHALEARIGELYEAFGIMSSRIDRLHKASEMGLHAIILSNKPMTSLVRNEAIAELQAALLPREGLVEQLKAARAARAALQAGESE